MKKNNIIILFSITIVLILSYLLKDDIIANVKAILGIKPNQYYGVTVDMSQLLPKSENYVVNEKGEDLIEISSKLGINSFRLTNITSISSSVPTPSFTKEQWHYVLNKMRNKGIHAVILIEGNGQDAKFHNAHLDSYYINFVRNYIEESKPCNASNVLAVDIRNEPIINKNNLIKLQEASNIVKSACPKTNITIGSWRTESGKKNKQGEMEYYWHDPRVAAQLNSIVDIHSVHIYGFDKPKDNKYPDAYKLTIDYLREMRKYTTKPILIEEFGAGNGTTTTDQNTLGNEELQAKAYTQVMKATYDSNDQNIIGAIAYLFYPRSNQPESWNIAKDNASYLLPAAYTFKKYSNN